MPEPTSGNHTQAIPREAPKSSDAQGRSATTKNVNGRRPHSGTVHNQVVETLRQSEARYRRIAQAVTDYVFTVQVEDGRVVETTHGSGCEAVTGYTAEEFANDPFLWIRMVPKEDRDAVCRQASQVLSGGNPKPLEHRVWRKDGVLRWLQNTLVPHYDSQGRVFSCDGLIRDITDRKVAEETLRQSQDMLAQAQRIASIGSWEWNIRTDEMIWSEQTYRMSGVEPGLAVPSHRWFLAHIHPDDRPLVVEAIERALLGGASYDVEYRFVASDSSTRWVHGQGEVVFDGSGQPSRMLGTVLDITERKQAVTLLQESESRYRTLVENMQVGIALLDSDHNIVMTNAALATMFHKSAADFAGRKCFREFEGREGVCEHCLGCRAMITGRPQEADTVCVRDDGTCFPARLQAFPTYAADGVVSGWIEIVEDITERKRAEEEARQRQAELAHVSRLNVMGELASGLAHELNQPLSTILCGAELSLRLSQSETKAAGELTDVLRDVAAEAERAGQIIHRLRRFVSKRPGVRSTVDVNALVQETLKLANPDAMQHGVAVRLELADSMPAIQADSIQVQQVMLNLIRNAIDAMKAPGMARRELRIQTATQDADTIEVAICDTGKGLDAEAIGRLFEPFFTTKPEGMGIGLSISRSIVESHGGHLSATSNPDGGMTFRFTLPTSGGTRDGD